MRPRERDPAERDERAFDPALRLADALGLALLLLAPLLADFPPEDLEREDVERALELRELLLRPPLLLDFPEPPLLAEAPPSIDHLPLITRLAASATASAISDPSLVALESTDFAALSAVSAASIPASRIAFRAFGLALIAAAAAARPAASISLLIATLASFSVVVLEEPDEREPVLAPLEPVLAVFERVPEDLAPVLLLDLAIANLPLSRQNRHLNRITVPFRPRKGAGFERIATSRCATTGKLKGTAAKAAIPSNMVSGRK